MTTLCQARIASLDVRCGHAAQFCIDSASLPLARVGLLQTNEIAAASLFPNDVVYVQSETKFDKRVVMGADLMVEGNVTATGGFVGTFTSLNLPGGLSIGGPMLEGMAADLPEQLSLNVVVGDVGIQHSLQVGAAVTARALAVSAQPGDATAAVTVVADGVAAAGVSLHARGCLEGGLYARLASAAPQYPAFGTDDTPYDAATLDGSGSTNSSLRVVGDNPRSAVLTLQSTAPVEARVVLDALGGFGLLRQPSAAFWEELPSGSSPVAYATGAWVARRLSAGRSDAATGWTRHGPPGSTGLRFNLSSEPVGTFVPVLCSADHQIYTVPLTLAPHQGVVPSGGVYRVRARGPAISAGGTQLRLRCLGSADASLYPPAFVPAAVTLGTGSSAFAATGGSQVASEIDETLELATGAVLELQQYFQYGADGNGGLAAGAPDSPERFASLQFVQLSSLG
jgi:hypothetical protein